MHVRSLAKITIEERDESQLHFSPPKHDFDDDEDSPGDGRSDTNASNLYGGHGQVVKVEVYSDVCENRVSPFMQSALCGLALVALPILRTIPLPVLHGLFVYFAMHSLIGNSLAERTLLLITEPALRPGSNVPYSVVRSVTLLQLFLVGFVFYIGEFAPDSIRASFPIFIVLLVPLRRYLHKFGFNEEHLDRSVRTNETVIGSCQPFCTHLLNAKSPAFLYALPLHLWCVCACVRVCVRVRARVHVCGCVHSRSLDAHDHGDGGDGVSRSLFESIAPPVLR
jgi:hypothetical protein